MNDYSVTIIGAGLAGCEAAIQLAKYGYKVNIFEMRPKIKTSAHRTGKFAELVCSNLLGERGQFSALGLLTEELTLLKSNLLRVADECCISSNGKIVVDRDEFSSKITSLLEKQSNINIRREIITEIPLGRPTIIATGPLTERIFSESISKYIGDDLISFYDASEPIINASSLHECNIHLENKTYELNDELILPLSENTYTNLIDAIRNIGELSPNRSDEFINYEQCQPIEVIAKKCFYELKRTRLCSKDIINPSTGKEDYAVIKFRKENLECNSYSIVGFMTRMSVKSQQVIFKKILGLKNVKFVRYGRMHRNTFIESPKVLDCFYSLKNDPGLYVIGQLSGVDGYLASVSSAIVASYAIRNRFCLKKYEPFPKTTIIGGLANYITSNNLNFQPMVASYGILPEICNDNSAEPCVYHQRSRSDLTKWLLEYSYNKLDNK